MRPLLLAALLLGASPGAAAECTPGSPAALAEAERAAADAEQRADLAESIAVRSGNPGAARRAEQARREARAARAHADALRCTPAPAAGEPGDPTHKR